MPLDTLTRLGHVSRCYVDIVACQVSCLYIATKSTIYFVKELVYDIDKNQLEQPGLQVNNYRARMVVEKIVVRKKTSLLKNYRIYPLHTSSVLWGSSETIMVAIPSGCATSHLNDMMA